MLSRPFMMQLWILHKTLTHFHVENASACSSLTWTDSCAGALLQHKYVCSERLMGAPIWGFAMHYYFHCLVVLQGCWIDV